MEPIAETNRYAAILYAIILLIPAGIFVYYAMRFMVKNAWNKTSPQTYIKCPGCRKTLLHHCSR